MKMGVALLVKNEPNPTKPQTQKNRPSRPVFSLPASPVKNRRETEIRLERVKGIEPSLSAWESMVGGVSGGFVRFAYVCFTKQNQFFECWG